MPYERLTGVETLNYKESVIGNFAYLTRRLRWIRYLAEFADGHGVLQC